MRIKFKIKYSLLFLTTLIFFNCFKAENGLENTLKALKNPTSKETLIACHRAAHNNYPENSLKAAAAAIEMNADIIEIDVRITKDNVPVILHDRSLRRTTNGTDSIHTSTLAEVKKLKLRLTDNGEVTGESIPTLEEMLLYVKGKILVDLDLKTDNMDAVVEVVKKTNTVDQILFFDGDFNNLNRVKELLPNAMLMPRTHDFKEVKEAFNVLGENVTIAHIDSGCNTAEVNNFITNNGARSWINSLGDNDKLVKAGKVNSIHNDLVKNGASIIQTDHPEIYLDYLEKK